MLSCRPSTRGLSACWCALCSLCGLRSSFVNHLCSVVPNRSGVLITFTPHTYDGGKQCAPTMPSSIYSHDVASVSVIAWKYLPRGIISPTAGLHFVVPPKTFLRSIVSNRSPPLKVAILCTSLALAGPAYLLLLPLRVSLRVPHRRPGTIMQNQTGSWQ